MNKNYIIAILEHLAGNAYVAPSQVPFAGLESR